MNMIEDILEEIGFKVYCKDIWTHKDRDFSDYFLEIEYGAYSLYLEHSPPSPTFIAKFNKDEVDEFKQFWNRILHSYE